MADFADRCQRASGSYDWISTAYDLIADPAEHAVRDRGLALLDVQRNERILDVGAGTGGALTHLAAQVGTRGLVCGLDSSAGMLARARHRIRGGHVRLQRGDARALPYRSACFDAAFLSFTLELFEPPDVARVLAEIRRVLSPRGRLAVVCLNDPSRAGIAASAYRWLHDHLPHWIDCRPIPVLDLLARARFQFTRTEQVALWGLPVLLVLAFPQEVGRRRRGTSYWAL